MPIDYELDRSEKVRFTQAKKLGWFVERQIGPGSRPNVGNNVWEWCKVSGIPYIKVAAKQKNAYVVIDFLAPNWYPSPRLAARMASLMGMNYVGGKIVREHSPRMSVAAACELAARLSDLLMNAPPQDRTTHLDWEDYGRQYIGPTRTARSSSDMVAAA